MKSKPNNKSALLRTSLRKVNHIHLAFVGVYSLATITFASWKLLTPDSINRRWFVTALMLLVSGGVWYLSRNKQANLAYYQKLVVALILIDTFVAAFTVYTERGMASRGVMLFAVPLAIASILGSRQALRFTAAFSALTYAVAAFRYFAVYPSEGYKVELYGIVGFYCAVFFVIAELLWVIQSTRSSK